MCVNICRQTDILSPGQLLHICTAAGILQKHLEKGKAESFQLDVKPLKNVQQSGEQQHGLGDECHDDEVSSVCRTSSFICGLDSAAFVLSSGVYVSKALMSWKMQTLFNFSRQKRYTIIVIESCGLSYFNLYCLAEPPDRLNSKRHINDPKQLFKTFQN